MNYRNICMVLHDFSASASELQIFAICLCCVGNEVCTILCLSAYLSPKASSKFGMRIGPLPLPVLAGRLRPKPGGMSDSRGASRTPTPPQLAAPCMSTPCVVVCTCILPHADVLLKRWSMVNGQQSFWQRLSHASATHSCSLLCPDW
jgi:hypothetical protein